VNERDSLPPPPSALPAPPSPFQLSREVSFDVFVTACSCLFPPFLTSFLAGPSVSPCNVSLRSSFLSYCSPPLLPQLAAIEKEKCLFPIIRGRSFDGPSLIITTYARDFFPSPNCSVALSHAVDSELRLIFSSTLAVSPLSQCRDRKASRRALFFAFSEFIQMTYFDYPFGSNLLFVCVRGSRVFDRLPRR